MKIGKNYSDEDVTADINDDNALVHKFDHDNDIKSVNGDTVSVDSRTLTADCENLCSSRIESIDSQDSLSFMSKLWTRAIVH